MTLNQHQQLYETIQKSNYPLITFRKDHNGDAIASSLALAEMLKKIGKPAEIVCSDFTLPHSYNFLPKTQTISDNLDDLKKIIISLNIRDKKHPELDYKVENNSLHIHVSPNHKEFTREDIKIHDTQYKHDLIIVLNTPDLESLDLVYHNNTDFFYNVPVINIDHSTENEHYGHLNYVNITASSVSEMIYDFIEHIDPKLLCEIIATHLLTGMIEKTKSFKIPTVTPKSLNIASQLMAAGAERQSIIENLYQKQTVGALHLWGRILLNLKTDDLQKIAWAEIPEKDFNETKAMPQDLIGVIEELIVSIPTVELTVLFYEKDNEKYCVIKSEKNIDLRSYFADRMPMGAKNMIKFKLDSEPQAILDKLKELI
ncbi:hypothetical protein HQ571_04925 [Candidatus Kuenenbacteria bacterium]|nr:hypothetical protein [Candidatus Kuenenbacteria bacterium]